MVKAKRKDLGLALNDLRMVSAIMGLLLIFSVGLECTHLDIPPWASGGTPVDNNNGGGNNTTAQPVEITVLEKTAYTSEGQTTPTSIDVGSKRVLALKATLTWSDDIGSNDDFGLAISNDTGDLDTVHGTSGSLELVIKASPGEYLLGPFEAKVTAISCPGRMAPIPVDRDSGNDWSLVVKATVED